MKMDRSTMARMAERMHWPVHIEPALQKALRWWLGELAGLVPVALRCRIAGLRSRYIVVSDGIALSLWRETGREREGLGRLDPYASAAAPGSLAGSRRGAGEAPLDAVMRLPAEQALRITAPLPLAAERNLEQVVGFEFDRLVPFRRNEAYYTYRVVAREKAQRRLQIELTALLRADIDALIQAAGRFNLHVTAVEVAPTSPLAPPDVISLENAGRGITTSRGRIVIGALAALVIVLAAAAVALPFLRAEERLDRLTVALTAARREADLSAKLQSQIDARLRDQHFLVDRRARQPTVTELLDVLTRLAPDDTWLTELQIAGTDVRLTGAANSATALLGLVDQSSVFRNAAFRSSVVQDQRLGRERFDIGAQIAPREAK